MNNQDLQQRYEAIRQVGEQLLARYREEAQRISAKFRPLAEWAQTPDGQAAIADMEQRRELLARGGECRCWCQIAHAHIQEVCDRIATTTAHILAPWGSEEVRMCAPCAEAARAERSTMPT